MKFIKIIPLVILSAILILSCDKNSDPLSPDIPNEIYSKTGKIDSIAMSEIGYMSKDSNFFTSGYDFTGLDSITVKFTYSKKGSAAIPVQIISPRGVGVYDVLYAVSDTVKAEHNVTITKRVLSPKRIATIGYSIRAEKSYVDDFGYVTLYDVAITRN